VLHSACFNILSKVRKQGHRSLGPQSDHRIDSRRTPRGEERRALNYDQQRDRQRDVDERLCRIDFERAPARAGRYSSFTPMTGNP
jgi:hypothetical protein